MKAISIKQPWAELIADGHKTIETRTWYTNHRGLILICASAKHDTEFQKKIVLPEPYLVAWSITGCAIAVAELWNCSPMQPADASEAMCHFVSGLYSWRLRDVRAIEPFPVKGQLGIFNVDYKP